MAYAQSAVTIKSFIIDGRAGWHVIYTETEVAAASTATITGLPEYGTITLLRVAAAKVTAATVQPAFGRTVGWTLTTSVDHAGQVAAAAATINDSTGLRYSDLVDGTLYVRTTPNAGADTSTTVEMTIMDGHF